MFLTGQSFQESVDGIRTLFATAQAYASGSLQIFQGSLALTPATFLEISGSHVRFLDPVRTKSWNYSATPRVCESVAHGLADGTLVTVWTSDAEGLPDGLSALTDYYIFSATPDTFHLALTPGGAPVDFAQASQGTLYVGIPTAPDPADGTLYYNAVTADIAAQSAAGFWQISAFREQYAPGAPDSTLAEALDDAEERVEGYVAADHWTSAVSRQKPLYRIFKRVIGELAFWYLSSRPGAIRQVTASSKKYADDVKEMSQKYSQNQSRLLTMTEASILAQLDAYKPPDPVVEEEDGDTESLAWWGTGRFVG